jgi:hypothetical protein
MLTKEEINELRYSTDTSRVERTISTGDMNKFTLLEAIMPRRNVVISDRAETFR